MDKVKILVKEMIPMRDGVKLAADIYMPEEAGKYPVALMRNPYGVTRTHSEIALRLASQGIVYVNMDTRGTTASEGIFRYPWGAEINDGKDTLEWIEKQTWCNGNIGMHGASYPGYSQWAAAMSGNENLKAIAPDVSPTDLHDSPHYIGGAFGLAVSAQWGLSRYRQEDYPGLNLDWKSLVRHLPVCEIKDKAGLRNDYWDEWISHSAYDEYWEAMDLNRYFHTMKTPAFISGGWYDLYSKHTLEAFSAMRTGAASDNARKFTRCIIGPWDHAGKTGEMEFGHVTSPSLEAIREKFLTSLLREPDKDPLPELPPLRYFMMGENKWRDSEIWPPAGMQIKECYLHSDGSANSLHGDGKLDFSTPVSEEEADHYIYNPRNPVPSAGGNNICEPPSGPRDQRAVEERDDVLVYSSAMLEESLTVAGYVKVTLYASSSAKDTDFTAKLVDVFPDGRAICLCDGVIRARYRESFREAKLMSPGKLYEFTIDCWVTANVFRKGHQIRLEISSSNFPRIDRNTNTGTDIAKESRLKVAMQTVFHNKEHPSHIKLPVLPQ